MVRRFHRSIYDELDELRASMDYLYQLALGPTDNPLLPPGESPDIPCRYLHNLNADVTLDDDEITVTVDTVPGPENSKVSVDLIDDTTLGITCEREEEECKVTQGNIVCGERSFSLHRLVPLPGPVMKYGARLSLRHGVLDIHLRRLQPIRP